MKAFPTVMTRIGSVALLFGAIWAIAVVGPRPAAAQEPRTTWTPEEKARIGVLLEERCERTAIAEERCADPPVVTSVVVDGPADLAGIETGDALITIDGLSVMSPEGRQALLNLEAGVTVELQVSREAEHVTIRVTPEMRAAEPYIDVRTMFFGPVPETPELHGEAEDVRVMRIPSVRSRLGEVEVRLDSLRSRTNSFVFFHEDSVGEFKIEVGDPEKAEVLLRQLREGDHAEGVRVFERAMPDGTGRISVTLGGVQATIPGYVWENEELARRLAKVRDSSLKSARMHLDSLVRLRHRVRVLQDDSTEIFSYRTQDASPDHRWAYVVGPRRVSGQLRSLFVTDLRVAGAEFRELHGDLADYFEGADAGLLVLRVIPDTPADRTGLREGDVVVEVNGEKCHAVSTLRNAMAIAGPSGELEVVWIRKGSRRTGVLGVN